MKIKLILLIFLSFLSFATSQNNFNISAYDSQLQDIFNGLVETEKKIGSFLNNLSDFVGEINGNLKSNKSRLYMNLSHLQLILQLQGSIKNYETYQQLTGCGNVASKISEIDVDLKKFSDFVNRLELNMTELYFRNLYVTYDLILSFEASQEAILDIILGVNEAMVQNLYYILQLQVNIRYEKSIGTNLRYFMIGSCKCNDDPSSVTAMTQNLQFLSILETTLLGRQDNVAAAANNTLMEFQKLTKSNNVTGKLKILASKVSILCRKIRRIDDYSSVTLPATNSCSALSIVQNFLKYRKFKHTQVLSFVATNTSVLRFYRKLFVSNINETIDQALNSSIIALNSSLNDLDNRLNKYAVEIKYQLSNSGLSSIIAQNQRTITKFCECLAGGGNTTVNSMTTTGMISSTNGKLSTTSATSEAKTTQKSTTNVATSSSTSTSKKLSTTPGSSASTSVSQTPTMSVNTTTSSISSISTTKPSTVSESSTKPPISTSSGTKTTPNPSISTPKVPQTLPSTASTTTLAPFSPSICSFTKTLTDMNGTYIKSACLVEVSSNGTFANSSCQANSMQLMTIDSNMTQTALNIFVQETLSEGTFWIGGGNGTDMCNFIIVNGTGSVIKQDRCSSLFSFYSICEYKDPNVPKKVNFSPNLDACGFVFPVAIENDKQYTRYACIMAYTRSYIDSSYNCMLNGMQLFNIAPKTVILTVNEFLVSFYGNNSGILIWANSTASDGSCSFLDGSKVPFAIAGGSCDQLYWSICEAPYDGSY